MISMTKIIWRTFLFTTILPLVVYSGYFVLSFGFHFIKHSTGEYLTQKHQERIERLRATMPKPCVGIDISRVHHRIEVDIPLTEAQLAGDLHPHDSIVEDQALIDEIRRNAEQQKQLNCAKLEQELDNALADE